MFQFHDESLQRQHMHTNNTKAIPSDLLKECYKLCYERQYFAKVYFGNIHKPIS